MDVCERVLRLGEEDGHVRIREVRVSRSVNERAKAVIWRRPRTCPHTATEETRCYGQAMVPSSSLYLAEPHTNSRLRPAFAPLCQHISQAASLAMAPRVRCLTPNEFDINITGVLIPSDLLYLDASVSHLAEAEVILESLV